MKLIGNEDFYMNLISEGIGVIAETILIGFVLTAIFKHIENKKWKPARIIVAKQIIATHRAIFSGARHIFNPDFKIDPKRHNMPTGTTQDKAAEWGRSIHFQLIKPELEKLKKTIEYNNIALDSFLMPKASEFLVSAEEVINQVTYFKGAYEKRDGLYGYIPNEKDLYKMEEVYTSLLKRYPDLKNGDKKKNWPTKDELTEHLINANKLPFLKMIKREPVEEKQKAKIKKLLANIKTKLSKKT